MRKLLLISMVILLGGCATVTPGRVAGPRLEATFIELDKFCKNNRLTYEYNTIDDIVQIKSRDKDLRLLLYSSLIYFNGATFRLKEFPFYDRGKVFLPRQLQDIIMRKAPIPQIPSIVIRKIVIDPGHGGKDPGATSKRGIKEKHLNLKVAKLLKEELEKKGFQVYLTRTNDTFLTLQNRVDIAKQRNADLFISIHANAHRNSRIQGVEVYSFARRYSSNKNDMTLSKEKLKKYEGHFANSSTIPWQLMCAERNVVSIETVSCMVDVFNHLGFKVVQKGAPFYVLKHGEVPSILIEIGYLTNAYEAKLLATLRYQRQIVEAITLGVVSLNDRYTKLVADYDRE